MKYYRNTLNCYRLPAANANAMHMQLHTPDRRRLTEYRDLCISSQNNALSDLMWLYRLYCPVACGSALAYNVATLSKLN